MRAVSLFAGIGGFDLALERAGVEVAAMVEIDKACQSVLRRHFPKARGFADIKSVDGRKLGNIDLVVGGFPCQDVSVAGKRAGLAGERTGLFFEAVRIINETTPRYIVLENVPGLLSSNDGRDMGTVLGTLEELGYGLAYRVLDAQYFGVAQRRRRVFIVGSLGDWNGPREILFEPESLRGDSAPGGGGREDIAGTLSGGAHPGGNGQDAYANHLIVRSLTPGQPQSKRVYETVDSLSPTLNAEDGDRNSMPTVMAPTRAVDVRNLRLQPGEISGTLQAKNSGLIVRRLTPIECERLQGFPDDWTAGNADSQRYRQTGNAVAVPVVEWIARRLVSFDNATSNKERNGNSN